MSLQAFRERLPSLGLESSVACVWIQQVFPGSSRNALSVADRRMPTFLAAPHVRYPPRRLQALRANPAVAVTIDTDDFPPEVPTIRGRAAISEVEGVDPEYALSARRYLGEEAARD